MMKYFLSILMATISTLVPLRSTTLQAQALYIPTDPTLTDADLKAYDLNVGLAEIHRLSKAAIAKYGSACTGTFISEDGLFLTAHHCAEQCISSLPDKKGVSDEGFIAQKQSEEKSCTNNALLVFKSATNVSDQFVFPDEMSSAVKLGKTKEIIKKLQDECQNPQRVCEVIVSNYKKDPYELYTYEKIENLKLVAAFPHHVALFGGNTHNFQWPRWMGDISLLRAYPKDSDMPYRPSAYVPISLSDVTPGDPLFSLGFPKETFRNISSPEARFLEEVEFVAKIKRNQVIINAIKMNYASPLDSKYKETWSVANNILQFDQYHLHMMKMAKVVRKKRQQDRQLKNLRGQISQLSQLIEKRRNIYTVYYLLNAMRSSGLNYATATAFSPAEKQAERIKKLNAEKDLAVEAEILAGYFDILQQTDYTLPLLHALRGKYAGNLEMAKSLLESSALYPDNGKVKNGDFENLIKEFDRIYQELQPQDSLLTFQIRELSRAINVSRGRKIPDANTTLRLNMGIVKENYKPDFKKGLPEYPYKTTLQGLIRQHNYISDVSHPDYSSFIVPEKIRNAPSSIQNMPVNFITNHLATLGNSGSSLINSSGKVVGVLVDITPEGVLSDLWIDEQARTIAVSMPYFKYLLETYSAPSSLLQELGLQ